jgi:hypothetical protein
VSFVCLMWPGISWDLTHVTQHDDLHLANDVEWTYFEIVYKWGRAQ